MKNPFFSVIIPTFNRCGFLKQAIESVLSQTETDFELIIIDDGSTDNTAQMIQDIADKRLVYVYQAQQGVSSARNQGIALAKAEFIAFLDSDDCFKPEKLQITRDYINRFPDIQIFHTEEIWYRDQKLLNQKKIHQKPDGWVFDNALKLCCIGMSTTVVKKELFKHIGYFDQTMMACEDYDLWLRASTVYPFKLIPQVLTIKHGGHADQLSRQYPAMDTLRIYAINKLIKTARLTDCQKNSAIKALKQKCLIYLTGAKKRGKNEQVKQYTDLMDSYDYEPKKEVTANE
ncbi:MAG: glycosyltransferase [Candidatus Omnitrophica bacterium]|nr:glycosyltransferase [Candidatus Omnitrophota bacterium]